MVQMYALWRQIDRYNSTTFLLRAVRAAGGKPATVKDILLKRQRQQCLLSLLMRLTGVQNAMWTDEGRSSGLPQLRMLQLAWPMSVSYDFSDDTVGRIAVSSQWRDSVQINEGGTQTSELTYSESAAQTQTALDASVWSPAETLKV